MLAASIRQWWAFVLQGVLGIVFGVLVLLFPGAAIVTFVALFAVWAVISGAGALAQGLREAQHRGNSWPYFLIGVVAIAAGIIAVFAPADTLVALIAFIGAWQLVTGLTEIYVAYRIRREIENEWLIAAAGLLRAILGLAFLLMPGLGVVVSLVVIAANAFAFGLLAIVTGLRLRTLRDRPASSAGMRQSPA
jgi:uncharacterized membrane protein HdeD (DUF308 family)